MLELIWCSFFIALKDNLYTSALFMRFSDRYRLYNVVVLSILCISSNQLKRILNYFMYLVISIYSDAYSVLRNKRETSNTLIRRLVTNGINE